MIDGGGGTGGRATGGNGGTTGGGTTGGGAGSAGAGSGGTSYDGGAGSAGAVGGTSTQRCPTGLSGPSLAGVAVNAGPTYCIDSTEVTNQHYAVFLAAAYPLNTADLWCSWNTTYTPQASWPPTGREDRPVVYVDWCDARAYCRWAGKHLCSASEWYTACSANGARLYPYGNAYDPAACVGSDFDGMPGHQSSDETRPVGTRTCEGAYPGIYDMSGNVHEWVDSCTDAGDAGSIANCLIRGGSFFESTTQLSCSQATNWNNNIRGLGVGFRCCVDPQN